MSWLVEIELAQVAAESLTEKRLVLVKDAECYSVAKNKVIIWANNCEFELVNIKNRTIANKEI